MIDSFSHVSVACVATLEGGGKGVGSRAERGLGRGKEGPASDPADSTKLPPINYAYRVSNVNQKLSKLTNYEAPF